MNSTLKKSLIFVLASLVLLFCIGLAMVSWHGTGHMDGGLFMFDHDYSDSVAAWMIVIPVIFFVMLAVGGVMVLSGVLAAGVMVLVFGAVLLAVAIALIPVAFIFAIPALVLYGLFKLIQRDRAVQPA